MDEKGCIARRLVGAAVDIAADDPSALLFQHSVMCQTSLPYRNPGDAIRFWDREQGAVALRIEAGSVRNPGKGDYVQLGLPYGPKPRLILTHLNAEALRQGSPEIEVEHSLTAFVRRLGVDTNGRNLRLLKDQLGRLSAATIRLSVSDGRRGLQINSQIVSAFDLWFPKDERQRVLWPSTVRLSLDYFVSLQKHAVPLDERAIAALAHSAMALDLYAWLAQRLHRIKPGKPQRISWAAVHAQFGWGFESVRKFRQVFRQALAEVVTQYGAARLELDDLGMTLHHSPPAVRGRVYVLPNP